MINTEKTRILKEGEETLSNILSKAHDNFDQYEEVSKISDLEVAKNIIERLLDRPQYETKVNNEVVVELQKNMCEILLRLSTLSRKEQYRLLKQFRKMIDNDIELSFEELFQKSLDD